MEQRDTMSVRDFAAKIGVSAQTAYRMLAEGRGPRFIRASTRGIIRIPTVAYREWLATRDDTASAVAS